MAFNPGLTQAGYQGLYNASSAVGTAAGLARHGYAAYKRARSWSQGLAGPPTKKRINTTPKGVPNVHNAGYVGRIYTKRRKRKGKRPGKRPVKRTYKRRKRSYLRGENYYAKYGAISTLEITGAVTDGDCVYLGHSSLVPTESMRIVLYALVRKLYKVAIGYEADNMKSIIPYKSGASQNSGGHTLYLKLQNNDNGSKTQQTFVIGSGKTLVDVGDQLFEYFKTFSADYAATKQLKLLWLELVDDLSLDVRAHIDLSTLYVDLYTKSDLKIQNCTIPSATAVETDNINNVPLVGRSYSMNHFNPRTSEDDAWAFNAVNQDTGMLLIRANEFPGQQYETWKEPPPSKSFVNCVASSVVRLEPGTIKNHISSTRKRMQFERFLLAISFRENFVQNRSVKIGSHDLMALERLLAREGDLPIRVQYECNYFHAATVSWRNKPAIMQKVTFASVSNVPA